jgi:phosphoglycerate dehydrogenase-like enzyme
MFLAVHLLRPPEQDILDHLGSQLEPDIRLTTGDEIPYDIQVLVGGRPSREQFLASPQLRTLIIPFTGLPDTTRDLLLEYDHVAAHNLHHNAIPVAEIAIALMLAAARGLLPMDRSLRTHDWRPRYEPNPGLLLDGATVLILGYGAIGQRVAQVCRSLGMRVIGIRRKETSVSGAEFYPLSALPTLLPQTQVLMVCLPGTVETSGLIGTEELALLPPGAVLVNVGRGPVVDQAALYTALRDGHLHSAGLDVWYNYPDTIESRANTPPSDYPFHKLDNVVMSPHHAGGAGIKEVERRRMEALAELLNAISRGETVPNQVNLDNGY